LKYHRIEYHSAQLAIIAAQLGVSPSENPDNITRPRYMRSKDFEIRLKRFKKHRDATLLLTRKGLEKWFIRNYSR
jgi:hypothetical protein